MAKRYNVSVTSGNINGITAGSAVAGASVFIGGEVQRVNYLSAIVEVDAETENITMAVKWQVSNDNSTWLDVANAPANTAATVLATGTSGPDAAVKKVIPAPDTVYGYRYARAAIVVGATTGTTNDTYSIGYSYLQLSPGECC